MAYRLTTCGLTTAGHKTLETLVIRQLRAILRLPAHLTQTTNQEVALQAGVLLSSGTLSAMLQREAQRRAHCQDHHVALPTGAWWKHVHASLRPTPEQDRLSLVASTAAPQVCPVCGVSYANRTALLTHLTKQHAAEYPTSRPEPFDKTLDAIGGLPQCSHCQKKFATWQLLQRHVEGNHCAVRHSFLPQPPADPVQPSMDRPPLFPESPIQDCINKYSSNAVYHLPNRHRYRQHCMLCGQWIASSKVMKLHYRQSHSDLANSYEQSATRLCQSYTASGTPCQYCGAHLVQPKAHKTVCPVLWQFCLNFACAQQAAHGNGGGAGRGHCSGDSVRQPGPKLCPILCRGSLGAEPDRVRASSQGCQGGSWENGVGLPTTPTLVAATDRGTRGRGKEVTRPSHKWRHWSGLWASSSYARRPNSRSSNRTPPGKSTCNRGQLDRSRSYSEAYKEQAKTKFMEAPVRAVLLRTLFQTLLHCLQALGNNATWQGSAML